MAVLFLSQGKLYERVNYYDGIYAGWPWSRFTYVPSDNRFIWSDHNAHALIPGSTHSVDPMAWLTTLIASNRLLPAKHSRESNVGCLETTLCVRERKIQMCRVLCASRTWEAGRRLGVTYYLDHKVYLIDSTAASERISPGASKQTGMLW